MPAGGPFGERLLPQIIDAYAQSEPERVYAMVPHSTDLTHGFRKITMRQLASAVDVIGWWIDRQIGHSDCFETLGYMGATDIRYGIFFFAAIKCGYKFLVPSARNSSSGNVSLLSACNCTKVFCTPDMLRKVHELEEKVPNLRYFVLASLDDLLTTSAPHYPYSKSHADGVKDPVLICHTSGSTGAPKPIILPNGAFSVIDNQRRLSKLDGRRNMDYSLFDLEGKGFINTFPGFHVGGIVAMTALPVFYDSHVVMVPSTKPANGEMMGQIMAQMPIRGVFTPPTVLEELLDTPKGLEMIAQTEFVMYGGGPLAPSAGDRISKVTCLTSAIGSTEAGIIPARVPTKENWSYFEWHPDYEVDMKHVHTDVYELTIPNPARLAWIHTIRHTFPEVDVWRTNDHYKQHPTNPKLFTFRGRGDDVIVLSNGEKFQPVTTESIIQSHPDIEGALVLGTGRFQPALIVEPRAPVVDAQTFIEQIWPIVQKANQEAAAHGRIFRNKIIITSPDKPLVRAGKGSIIRPKSTALYVDEVEALFSSAGVDKELGTLSEDQVKDVVALKISIRKYVQSILPDLPKDPDEDKADFFAYGLDSVQTIDLASGLRAQFRPHLEPALLSTIAPKEIYANSSVESLARFIGGLLALTTDEAVTNREARMKAMLELYTNNLPARDEVIKRHEVIKVNSFPHTNGNPPEFGSPGANERSSSNGIAAVNGNLEAKTNSLGSPLCVLLTGSTGSLGMQLLQALLQGPQISKVICLNRAHDALQRTKTAFSQRGITPDLSKAVFHKAQFSDLHFGLLPGVYTTLQDEVQVIIHNAWNVNFNQSLESFQDHIHGVRNFISLSTSSTLHPRLMFVSSISSVANWAACYPDAKLVPEASLTEVDYSVALPMGYGESKHVSERMLAIASATSGVKVDILRLGQVAGPIAPDGGCWNKSEWFPSLIQTSKSLGYLPDALMDVDWIPADILAHNIRDLVHYDHEGIQTYNLINPHGRSWKDLVPFVQELIGGNVVSLKEWTERLRQIDGNDVKEVAAKPALKILDWFSGIATALESGQEQLKYATIHGVQASETMAKLGPVSQEWMTHWLERLSL